MRRVRLLAVSGSLRSESTNAALLRAIPGGLKNAIDWLVSRDEILGKPITLAHASHRGDDMLGSLRSVLSTVSPGFDEAHFLRLPLMGLSPERVRTHCESPENARAIRGFVRGVRDRAAASRG